MSASIFYIARLLFLSVYGQTNNDDVFSHTFHWYFRRFWMIFNIIPQYFIRIQNPVAYVLADFRSLAFWFYFAVRFYRISTIISCDGATYGTRTHIIIIILALHVLLVFSYL